MQTNILQALLQLFQREIDQQELNMYGLAPILSNKSNALDSLQCNLAHLKIEKPI